MRATCEKSHLKCLALLYRQILHGDPNALQQYIVLSVVTKIFERR